MHGGGGGGGGAGGRGDGGRRVRRAAPSAPSQGAEEGARAPDLRTLLRAHPPPTSPRWDGAQGRRAWRLARALDAHCRMQRGPDSSPEALHARRAEWADNVALHGRRDRHLWRRRA